MRWSSPLLTLGRVLGLGALGLTLASGCTDPEQEDDDAETTGPPIEIDPLVIPTNAFELEMWLAAEPYLEWPAESAIHGSTGPHFGNVRTWLHPDLFDSLEAGVPTNPANTGTVKELYGDGMARRGWSVSVKTQEDSAGGDGWYWYELFDGAVLADAQGLGVCTGCHGGGVDYVLTPFPLQ